MEDELAARGGGVDRLLEAPEPDPTLGEARDGVDQVPKGTTEPVQLPHDQGVAGAQLVQDLLEDREPSWAGEWWLSQKRWRSQWVVA
jgi:hypothetical protein